MPIYEAAKRYKERKVPLIVTCWKRIWDGLIKRLGKGNKAMGIKAVIVESLKEFIGQT